MFDRRTSYTVLQVYLPSYMIVILSFMALWIPQEAVPARVGLGITTVLTIVYFFGKKGNTSRTLFLLCYLIYCTLCLCNVFEPSVFGLDFNPLHLATCSGQEFRRRPEHITSEDFPKQNSWSQSYDRFCQTMMSSFPWKSEIWQNEPSIFSHWFTQF